MNTSLNLLLLLALLVGLDCVASTTRSCPVHCKCDSLKHLVNCTSEDHGRLETIPVNIPADTEILILDQNNISTIYKDGLSNLRHLKSFSAKKCMLAHIHIGAFENLNELTKIELGRNKLSNFTLKNTLPVLSYLDLSTNHIKFYQNISVCQIPRLATLDLSYNWIKTSAIPKDFSCLRNLTTFILDSNQLGKIEVTDFAPLTNSALRNISMSNCSLRIISREALIPIRNVTRFTLRDNRLAMNKTVFVNAMKALCALPFLEQLDLAKNRIKKFTAQNFMCFKRLKYFSLKSNCITYLPAKGFEVMTSLEELDLSNNSIKTITKTSLKGLHNLKNLTFAKNQLTKIPRNIFLSSINESYMPSIEIIKFHRNKIEYLQPGTFKGLHNLRKLDIGSNVIQKIENAFDGLHSLTHLWLDHQHYSVGLTRISRTAFQPLNETLVYLSLEGNRYSFGNGRFHFLRYIPRITDLFLSDNKIGGPSALKQLIPEKMRKSLRRLSLGHMAIREIPVGTFTGMYNLQKLELGDNNIAFWDPKVFANLSSLTNLWLKHNDIRILNESSLGDVWYQLTFFRAELNQYACDCDLLWFVNWIKNATKHNVTIPSEPYICAFPKNMEKKSILEYKPADLECVAWWLIVAPSVAGFLALLTLSVAFGCWYRHHLRLCCFRNFGIGYKEYEAVDGDERDYDAFISYSQDDMAWVIQTLVQTLERQYGFKVFFEDRDYTLGEMMVDNIISGIESSRRVIIVLSQSFLEGQWCGLEVQLIQKKLLKKLIVIKVDDVQDFELSPTLGWILREGRYIAWDEHPVAQELFWEKLNHAIQEKPYKPRLCALC